MKVEGGAPVLMGLLSTSERETLLGGVRAGGVTLRPTWRFCSPDDAETNEDTVMCNVIRNTVIRSRSLSESRHMPYCLDASALSFYDSVCNLYSL